MKKVIKEKRFRKLSKMWMGKEYKYPIQDCWFGEGHWFLRIGRVVVESTTRQGCLESRKDGDKVMLDKVRLNDIERIGW
jgi:hypothetical protein